MTMSDGTGRTAFNQHDDGHDALAGRAARELADALLRA